MESVPDAKYQKLASEYAKLRAKAGVLKNAVLEEQAKEAALREQIRHKDTSLRRAEQEIDSLGFRNKQLESRVGALQQELANSEVHKKKVADHNKPKIKHSDVPEDSNPLLFEELQKKVMENAQLSSLIDDKERDLILYAERVSCLEQKLEKHISEHNDVEKRLRKDYEVLQNKNSELETKLVEAASMLGSEDALSATDSDTIFNHHQTTGTSETILTADMRLAALEKDVAHWRAQYEVAKLRSNELTKSMDSNCSCSTTAAGLTVRQSNCEHRTSRSLQEPEAVITNEQLIYNHVSEKYEDLLRQKCFSDSRYLSFETEVNHLQNCLENATYELRSKDDQVQSLTSALQMLEEDLTTTRMNYDEQISVLTEQIISLSEQLAASK